MRVWDLIHLTRCGIYSAWYVGRFNVVFTQYIEGCTNVIIFVTSPYESCTDFKIGFTLSLELYQL